MTTLPDALIAYAVYLELLKKRYRITVNNYLSSVQNALQHEFTRTDTSRLTRAKFVAEYRRLSDIVDGHVNGLSQQLRRQFNEFTTADKLALAALFRRFMGGRTVEITNDYVRAQIIAASGVNVTDTLALATVSTAAALKATFARAYANRSDRDELLAALALSVGKSARGVGATFDTVVQHGSSVVADRLMRVHFERYMWLSILDNVTTDICRSRHRNIYFVGRGPLPPAHYGCRSRTVPFDGYTFGPEYDTYAAWFALHSSIVREDERSRPNGIELALFVELIGELRSGS